MQVTYGTYAEFQFDLDDYTNVGDLRSAIYSIPYREEMTNMSGGIRLARQRLFDPTGSGGDRRNNNNVDILITDGESNRYL